MRSKFIIAMPVILLLMLLAYPIVSTYKESESGNVSKYSVEIVQTATEADNSVCRWGFKQGKKRLDTGGRQERRGNTA